MNHLSLPLYFDTLRFLEIFLLVDLIFVSAFLVWAVYVGSRIGDFKRKLKKRLYAITILLNEKKDIIIAMSDFFVENGIKLNESQEAAIACLRFLPIEDLKDSDVKTVETTIKDAVIHVKFLASTNPSLAKNEAFMTLNTSLNDIDANYRQALAIYNSDVIGYTYWYKSVFTHWLFHLFGNRSKDPIN